MSFMFGLQKTRDSLKEAFESLFEKYGKEFDDDDEIDIMSLEVVKKSNKSDLELQRPRKFGFLYRKEGEQISEDEEDEEEEGENSGTETENDPTALEKIFNERSNALISVSSSKLDPKSLIERKPRKTKKRTTQLAFDFAVLRILELETSRKLKNKVNICCPRHSKEISKECFDCSLINIIS